MSPTSKQMGARVRQLRKARKLSQAALAERAGLTRAYVTRLEAGQQDPSLSTITALAKALGVAAASLLR
jgi:transcriptional regulator with XRE-family HTH domain